MAIGIYEIRNIINGKMYVGSSVSIEDRFNQHKSNEISSENLQKDIKKFGIKNFEFNILEICERRELEEKEKFWILKYWDLKVLYNKSRNTYDSSRRRKGKECPTYGKKNGLYGVPLSKERIELIRKIHLGKSLSEEHKRKIGKGNKGKTVKDSTKELLRKVNSGSKNYMYGKYGENHHNFGKTHSKETKQKISENLKDRFVGDKNPMWGKKLTEEHRDKLRKAYENRDVKGENNPFYGKTHSEETRRKISDAGKGRKLTEELKIKAIKNLNQSSGANHPGAKSIIVKDLKGTIVYRFGTRKQASEELKLRPNNITYAIKDRTKFAGFMWELAG